MAAKPKKPSLANTLRTGLAHTVDQITWPTQKMSLGDAAKINIKAGAKPGAITRDMNRNPSVIPKEGAKKPKWKPVLKKRQSLEELQPANGKKTTTKSTKVKY